MNNFHYFISSKIFRYLIFEFGKIKFEIYFYPKILSEEILQRMAKVEFEKFIHCHFQIL